MKYFLFFIVFLIFIGNKVFSQKDTTNRKTWLSETLETLKIGQSLATSELRGNPAQLQVTIPKNSDSTSYLINLGASININKGTNLSSKLNIEYHKNTLITNKQNNTEIGYMGIYTIARSPNDDIEHFLIFDPKYIYDGETIKNSIASNLLFTWINSRKGNTHWNSNNFWNKKRASSFLSLHLGAQFQDIFQAKVASQQGFIMRPLYDASASFCINNIKKDKITPHPIIKFSLSYSGRYDMINNTGQSEGYTQLLKTGMDWYLATDPVKVSIGVSFNYGSDPISGLVQQQFWLVSINVSK